MIMLNKQANGKRKAKGNSEENLSSKAKAKRYRRPCDSDEFPSTMILDKDEEIDEQVKPFEYRPIDEEEILSRKKFKKPAEDEDVFDPNRPKKEHPGKNGKRAGGQHNHKSLSYPFPKKK